METHEAAPRSRRAAEGGQGGMPPPGPSPRWGVAAVLAAPRTPKVIEAFWCAPRAAAQRPSARTEGGGVSDKTPTKGRRFSPQGGGADPPGRRPPPRGTRALPPCSFPATAGLVCEVRSYTISYTASQAERGGVGTSCPRSPVLFASPRSARPGATRREPPPNDAMSCPGLSLRTGCPRSRSVFVPAPLHDTRGLVGSRPELRRRRTRVPCRSRR